MSDIIKDLEEQIGEASYELFIDIMTLKHQGYTKEDFVKHQGKNYGNTSQRAIINFLDVTPLEPLTVKKWVMEALARTMKDD